MAVHWKMENLQICQPEILIGLLLSPRGSQTTNRADFKNILFKIDVGTIIIIANIRALY